MTLSLTPYTSAEAPECKMYLAYFLHNFFNHETHETILLPQITQIYFLVVSLHYFVCYVADN